MDDHRFRMIRDNSLREAEGEDRSAHVLRLHRHLMETCPDCGVGWQRISPTLRTAYLDHLSRAYSSPPPRFVHLDDLPPNPESIFEQEQEARHRRRRASKQLSELRQTSRERRPAKIKSATLRFQSRLLAELLLDEARKTVRNDPAEAESFASLVPMVLDWTVGQEAKEWTNALVALAEAHRANALRVAGQLPAAEQVFDMLHQAMPLRPVADAAVVAEIASLEGSLRIDQRRCAQAQEVLERAALAFRYAGDGLGFAKAQIQLANLMQAEERPEDALRLLEEAADQITSDAPPYLATTVVAGRITALCDLHRPLEARRILHASLDSFEADEAPHTGAALRFYEGRIAFELGEHAAAADLFASCSRVMMDLGRHYDAALAALYLAETYLAQGRTAELRRLAASLAQDFAEREVAGEALKASRLLARAAAAEEVSAAFLFGLRLRLQQAAA